MCNEIKRNDNNKVEDKDIDLDRLYKATRTVVNNMSEVEIKTILEVVVGSICAEYMRTDNTTKVDNNSQMTPELNAGTCIQCINTIYTKCKKLNTALYNTTAYVGVVDAGKQYTLNEILKMCKTTINASSIIYANVRDVIKHTPNRTEIVSRLSALINNYYIGDYAIEYIDSHETMLEKLRAVSNYHRTKPVRKQAYDYIMKHGSLKGFGKCKMEDAWSLDEHEDKFLNFCYVLMLIKTHNIDTDRILDEIMDTCPDHIKYVVKHLSYDKERAIDSIKEYLSFHNIPCSKFSGKIRLFLNKTIQNIISCERPTPTSPLPIYMQRNLPYGYIPYNCMSSMYQSALHDVFGTVQEKEEEK